MQTYMRERILKSIKLERGRQCSEEDFTYEHDDEHTSGELALAACYYAHPYQIRHNQCEPPRALARLWPGEWDPYYARKRDKNRRRQLVVATALIVAEIERLDRAIEHLERSVSD
jgi:hypothetical protein